MPPFLRLQCVLDYSQSPVIVQEIGKKFENGVISKFLFWTIRETLDNEEYNKHLHSNDEANADVRRRKDLKNVAFLSNSPIMGASCRPLSMDPSQASN